MLVYGVYGRLCVHTCNAGEKGTCGSQTCYATIFFLKLQPQYGCVGVSSSRTPSPTRSVSPSPTNAPSSSPSLSPSSQSPFPSRTVSPSPTSTVSPSRTSTVSPSRTPTVSPSPTSTVSPSFTSTVSLSPTSTASPSPSGSPSASVTSASLSPTSTASPSPSGSPSASVTSASLSPTSTASPSDSPTGSSTSSPSPSASLSSSASLTSSRSPPPPVAVGAFPGTSTAASVTASSSQVMDDSATRNGAASASPSPNYVIIIRSGWPTWATYTVALVAILLVILCFAVSFLLVQRKRKPKLLTPQTTGQETSERSTPRSTPLEGSTSTAQQSKSLTPPLNGKESMRVEMEEPRKGEVEIVGRALPSSITPCNDSSEHGSKEKKHGPLTEFGQLNASDALSNPPMERGPLGEQDTWSEPVRPGEIVLALGPQPGHSLVQPTSLITVHPNGSTMFWKPDSKPSDRSGSDSEHYVLDTIDKDEKGGDSLWQMRMQAGEERRQAGTDMDGSHDGLESVASRKGREFVGRVSVAGSEASGSTAQLSERLSITEEQSPRGSTGAASARSSRFGPTMRPQWRGSINTSPASSASTRSESKEAEYYPRVPVSLVYKGQRRNVHLPHSMTSSIQVSTLVQLVAEKLQKYPDEFKLELECRDLSLDLSDLTLIITLPEVGLHPAESSNDFVIHVIEVAAGQGYIFPDDEESGEKPAVSDTGEDH